MKTKVIPHFLDCKEWNNIKLKKVILTKIEDEKNELLFYLQDEHDFRYNKTSIFDRSYYAKIFAKSVIVMKI